MRKFLQSIIGPGRDIPAQDGIVYMLLLFILIAGTGIVYYLIQAFFWLLLMMFTRPVETFTFTLFLLVLYVLGLKWMKQL